MCSSYASRVVPARSRRYTARILLFKRWLPLSLLPVHLQFTSFVKWTVWESNPSNSLQRNHAPITSHRPALLLKRKRRDSNPRVAHHHQPFSRRFPRPAGPLPCNEDAPLVIQPTLASSLVLILQLSINTFNLTRPTLHVKSVF